MSGAGGGMSTGGGGGGFVQGTNAFSGLTNTDLRPRSRRRPVPLLNTSWLINRRRRQKGHPMRKDISGLVGLLEQSMLEIATAGLDGCEERMHKSAGEFEAALLDVLDPILPADAGEPLADGLNHIALFSHALSKLAQDIDLIKSGQGVMMILNKAEPDSELDEETADALDRYLDIGDLLLRSMANDTASVPADERDLMKAERAGLLVKLESFDGEDILLKSALPEGLRSYLTDPLELMGSMVETSRSFLDTAIEMAEPMAKQDLISPEFAAAYPELFEPMIKASPPFGKKPMAQDEDQNAQDDTSQDDGLPEDGGSGDPVGDGTQNPIELMVRMASIIVVVGGSLLQGQQAGDQPDDSQGMPNAGPGGMPQGQPLQRSVPIEDVPLAKILSGEIVVSDTLGEALQEREDLKKWKATAMQEKAAAEANLRKMQETIARLGSAPGLAKGVVFEVNKTGDVMLPSTEQTIKKTREIEELAKVNPEAAAKAMLKMVHAGGGAPLIPPR